ncbi:MAG: anti-sigma F factor [Oscillospiraceae bacterium]|nr:anti-sigma F factor [Oscillospiraceae bacterium]MBP1575126.1 anti-sigma F factor [Oscillospiraceae bacterium]MBQ5322734.1 anti-sigma F factor [Oscillospiraceae bacterium]MBQ8594692.1 anti-sigma F factor [Oscillospiraceae bacterium]
MKPVNEMKMSFESRSCNESFARSSVAAFISVLDPNVEEISDIKTAVSEAVTNCIVHGYKNEIGKVYIHVKIFEGARIRISVKDKGCGIPDIKKAMEPLYTTCETGERAGLGFSIMESFMDNLKVRSKPGRGTSVTLEKSIVSKGK